jgi:hypothetical protein
MIRPSSRKSCWIATLPSAIRRVRVDQFLAMILLGTLPFAPACTSSEPCAYTEPASVDPQVTPFSDGTSVFSACTSCPILPITDLVANGAATACEVGFSDTGSQASVNCFYGPQGNVSGGQPSGNVPSVFAFCAAHCPDQSYLHACFFNANASGVTEFSCWYGEQCD